MKRTEIEGKVKGINTDVRSRIEKAPIPAFFLGVFIGFALGIFRQALVPVLILAVIAGVAVWLLSEKEESIEDQKPSVNGRGKSTSDDQPAA